MQPKIRLLYVIYSLDNGGAETLAIRLAEKLSKDLFDVVVCSLSDRGPLRTLLEQKHIRYFTLGKREGKDPGVALRLRKVIRDERIDIIHTHNQGPLLYTYLATRMMRNGPKIVHTEHINMVKEFSYSRKHMLYNSLLYRSLDGFINIARHLTDSYRDAFTSPHTKIQTIHNCVDLAEYDFSPTSDLRAELDLKQGTPLIGCISALRRQKDHDTLLKAMEKVKRDVPETVLVLAGDGELRDELLEQVRQLDLSWNVKFLGFRSDIANLLAQFDIFVLASLYEGLPLCILEAMAAGKPVVATDADGTNELIVNGETGLLVPLRDPGKFADAILSLLQDADMAADIGSKAKMFVEKQHNFNTMIHEYKSFYRNMINQSN